MEAVISGVIGGIFTIAGVWYSHYLQNRRIETPQRASFRGNFEESVDYRQPERSPSNLGTVIRDTGIIMVLTAVGGLIVGISSGGNADFESMALSLAVSNI